MKLSKETESQLIMKLLGFETGINSTYEPGKVYVIRTVTMIYLGKIKEEHQDHLVLSEAAWIADTGRWNEFLKGQKPSEMEPYMNDVKVYKGGFLDSTEMTSEIKIEVL
jgi:hypothetical protein